jgi:hypothetical protein
MAPVADPPDGIPQGVLAASCFFLLAGVLEVVLAVIDRPEQGAFWPIWEAAGRGMLEALVAVGLWRRFALCRVVAVVYCLAALVTYLAVLGFALGGVPARYPATVVVQSLYHIPSCALLLPYLRSARAVAVFARPLWGR